MKILDPGRALILLKPRITFGNFVEHKDLSSNQTVKKLVNSLPLQNDEWAITRAKYWAYCVSMGKISEEREGLIL